jgi:hypothetical protein
MIFRRDFEVCCGKQTTTESLRVSVAIGLDFIRAWSDWSDEASFLVPGASQQGSVLYFSQQIVRKGQE